MREKEIKEIIIVEGRDDTCAVQRALRADTIETHGFGIRQETWDLMARAYETRGILLFTDPDHSGEAIRRRITARFPLAKQAFLDREKATAGTDIGIENAAPEDIREAIFNARASGRPEGHRFSEKDMRLAGLWGGEGAAGRRSALGRALGIGYGNSKGFLRKLNQYEITEEELHEAIRAEECRSHQEKTQV